MAPAAVLAAARLGAGLPGADRRGPGCGVRPGLLAESVQGRQGLARRNAPATGNGPMHLQVLDWATLPFVRHDQQLCPAPSCRLVAFSAGELRGHALGLVLPGTDSL